MDSGDILSTVGFDPLKVNIGFIQDTAQLLPKSGHIELDVAEELATRFLRCADYCSDMLARASHCVSERETLMKSARADAIEKKIADGVSATAAKELFGNDPMFVERSREHGVAVAWRDWLDQKYQNLIKAHHHCKEIMKAYTQGRPAAGWQGDIPETEYQSVNESPPIDPTHRGETELW